jgi:hypothetical protein
VTLSDFVFTDKPIDHARIQAALLDFGLHASCKVDTSTFTSRLPNPNHSSSLLRRRSKSRVLLFGANVEAVNMAAPTCLLKALRWEVTQKKNLKEKCGKRDLCFMSNGCGVPLGVSAVRVSRIDCMNYVSGTIEAVAVTPVKSLPRMAERYTEEEIGSDDTLDLMRYCESYIFPLLGTQ